MPADKSSEEVRAALDRHADTHEWFALFELAPVSLWLEDFSALAQLFRRLRAEGVSELRPHLLRHPEDLRVCTEGLRVLCVNRRTLSLFGARDQAHLVANLGAVFRDDMLDHHVQDLERLWRGELSYESQTVNYTLDGRRLDVRLSVRVLPGHETDWSRVLLSLEDITARVQAQRELQASERYANGLFEHSPVSLWVEDFSGVKRLLDEVREQGITDFRTFTDVHPDFVERCMAQIRVLRVNRQTLRLFRSPDQATLVARLSDVFRDEMRRPFTEQLIELWNGQIFQQRETVNYTLDGELLHVHLQFSVLPGHEHDWSLVQVSLTDISARKKAEAYLEFLGKHDALTKLRNRSFFSDEINRLERRGLAPLGILLLDVNGLKRFNDETGHAAGDALLRRAGEVLAKAVEAPMTASRIGGDEFVLLMPGADEAAVEAMQAQVEELLELNNQFHAGALLEMSVGRAVWRGGERIEAAVHRADTMMYEHKKAFYAARTHDRRA
ncbi:sensor domain-containing diguanylate cyclase [Roseateles flavus]|uniref:Diguanylate cyclase n=1 Tax=Roseateles flavus TaxID=3149041 RepID=A0ABV0GF85_9BURK